MKKYIYVYSPKQRAVVYGDRVGWSDGNGPVLIRDGVTVAEFNDEEEVGESPEEAMANARKYAEKQIKDAEARFAAVFHETERTKVYYTTLIRELTSMK